MAKILNVFGKIIFGAFVCSVLLINSSTSFAADNNKNAMKVFREMITATAKVDDRVFREDIFFVIPKLQTELDLIGKTDGENFKASGDFNLWSTDQNGNSTDVYIPFHAVQNGKDMKIYYQIAEKWYQFSAPSLAAVISDMIATPTQSDIDEIISDVKDVQILQEKENQITMLVTLDSKKIAKEMQTLSKENPADKGTADDKEYHDSFTKHFENALKNSNIWYVWTVDKTTNQTVTLSLNLSELIQQFAYSALQDNENNFGGLNSILEAIAFYSETKAYTTFLNAEAGKKLEIPQEALEAASVEDMIADSK